MKKINCFHIFVVLMSLSLLASFTNLAQAAKPAKKEQFGEIKGVRVPPAPLGTPVKENICKNPQLCDSIEIELLSELQQAKVPVFLPAATATSATEDYKVALNLGIVVADALAADINKNKAAFLKNAAMADQYAKKLGVSEAILQKYSKITEAANKGEWNKIGSLLYDFKADIVNELSSKNKQDLANLAMVSGGLEGLHLMAQSVNQKFSKKSAALLRKPGLVKFLDKNTKSLSPAMQSKAEVKAMVAALPQIDKLINRPKDHKYTKSEVQELLKISAPLRQSLMN